MSCTHLAGQGRRPHGALAQTRSAHANTDHTHKAHSTRMIHYHSASATNYTAHQTHQHRRSRHSALATHRASHTHTHTHAAAELRALLILRSLRS